jgi:hypothetical protein
MSAFGTPLRASDQQRRAAPSQTHRTGAVTMRTILVSVLVMVAASLNAGRPTAAEKVPVAKDAAAPNAAVKPTFHRLPAAQRPAARPAPAPKPAPPAEDEFERELWRFKGVG